MTQFANIRARGLSPFNLRHGLHLFIAMLAALQVVFTTASAWAWPPTYGAEYEFTNATLRDAPEFVDAESRTSAEKKAQLQFVEKIKQRCLTAGCIVKRIKGKWDTDYTVTYPDGWFFKISFDPKCVEITFRPATLAELKKRESFMNEQIFQTARDAGLHVEAEQTAHFNFGVRATFNDDAKEFLRFFVDYSNHPDLGLGSLGRNLPNAPPLAILDKSQRHALQAIVKAVEQGEMTTIKEVAQAIQSNVYTKSYIPEWGGADHFQALGIKYVNRTDLTIKDAPMEIRAVWGQENQGDFNLVAELIEARVAYLRTIKDPILYTETTKTDFTYSELKTRFQLYVEEAGLDFKKFAVMLPTIVGSSPDDDFIRSDARLDDRLARIDSYWDLLPVSQAVRAQTASLIAEGLMHDSPLAKSLLGRIENQGLKRVSREIEKKRSIMRKAGEKSARTNLAKRLIQPLSCQALFL